MQSRAVHHDHPGGDPGRDGRRGGQSQGPEESAGASARGRFRGNAGAGAGSRDDSRRFQPGLERPAVARGHQQLRTAAPVQSQGDEADQHNLPQTGNPEGKHRDLPPLLVMATRPGEALSTPRFEGTPHAARSPGASGPTSRTRSWRGKFPFGGVPTDRRQPGFQASRQGRRGAGFLFPSYLHPRPSQPKILTRGRFAGFPGVLLSPHPVSGRDSGRLAADTSNPT